MLTLVLTLQLAVVHASPLHGLFGTQALSGSQWAVPLAVGLFVLALVESMKRATAGTK